MPYKTTPLPIQAGWYWFRGEASPWSTEDLVSVRFKQEELTRDGTTGTFPSQT
jgi:hypothetical protein